MNNHLDPNEIIAVIEPKEITRGDFEKALNIVENPGAFSTLELRTLHKVLEHTGLSTKIREYQSLIERQENERLEMRRTLLEGNDGGQERKS